MKYVGLVLIASLIATQSKASVVDTWYGIFPGSRLEFKANGSVSVAIPIPGKESKPQLGNYKINNNAITFSKINSISSGIINRHEVLLAANGLTINFRRKDAFTETEKRYFALLMASQAKLDSVVTDHRALETYAQNIYKTIFAYNSDYKKDPPSGSCLKGYTAGNFPVIKPTLNMGLVSCTVVWPSGSTSGGVEVRASDGFKVTLP